MLNVNSTHSINEIFLSFYIKNLIYHFLLSILKEFDGEQVDGGQPECEVDRMLMTRNGVGTRLIKIDQHLVLWRGHAC